MIEAMVGNPYRYRAALQQLENRNATAGCLLALLFVIPFAARTYSMAVLATGVLFYVVLLVPLATGFISLGYIIRQVKQNGMAVFDFRTYQYLLRQAWLLLCWLHLLYRTLIGIRNTPSQMLFFVLAEKALCPDQRFVSLYGLLFCYLLAYLYQSLHRRHWAHITLTTSTADFLRLTSAFIIVRLGKGVAMSLVLITLTLQFDHLEPSIPFVLVTSLYFCITQFLRTRGKEHLIIAVVQWLDWYIFEGLEEFWIPLIMYGVVIMLSSYNIVLAMSNVNNIPFCILTFYTNVIVILQQMEEECLEPLAAQNRLMERFPRASRAQLRERGESTCPICLDDINVLAARITPCQHIFHGHCLRRCLLQYRQCPMCKQPFIR